ncbi:hypothetical protein MmonteBS_35100 [Mycobacterium montefiorense]|uniref:Uncharacterized protein n=1 Tax=Mycobacterium montefiorense TaxID=154654 RepID=A0ABQ0NQP1_9MYCO|nr:hypothetical protein MmonteBS_35100 [Mycobacterium montefiorense]
MRLGTGHLRLQRAQAGAGSADLRVQRITFGLSEIELAGHVLVFVAELIDGGVERFDLRRTLRKPDVICLSPHHRLVDQVDDAQVGRL